MAEGAKARKASRARKQQGTALQTVLNVFGVVLCVLFIPIIILNVVMIVRSYTDPDHIPSVFGYSPVIVLSGSMSPEFEAGDLIFIQKTDPDTLQVGDVICFMEEETAITHRIIEVQRQDGELLYVTKGDANNVEDSLPVRPAQVQGKYTDFYISKAGDFAIWLQSTPGMLICVGGPIIFFLLWDVLRRMIQSRQNARETEKMQSESSTREQEMAAMAEELQKLRAKVGQGSAPVEQDAVPVGQRPAPAEQGSVTAEQFLSGEEETSPEEPPLP